MGRIAGEADARRDLRAARRRAALGCEPRAESVRYDSRRRRLVLGLSNDAEVSVPVSLIARLRGASDDVLADVAVGPAGLGLHWDALGEDVSVAGLLEAVLGTKALMRAAGSAGGSVRSAAKARAARLNGRKGGRPRTATRRQGASSGGVSHRRA